MISRRLVHSSPQASSSPTRREHAAAISRTKDPAHKDGAAGFAPRGQAVSLDINIRLRASIDTKAYLDGVRSLLPLADIVKASDEDLEPFEFAADARKAAARAYEEMGSGMLVLTEGGGGATLYTARGTLEKATYPVANMIDTVGAGDTFHSAFLASLYRADAIKRPYREIDASVLGDAVDFACAAAAINVSRAGFSPPTQEEVESYRRSVKR